jgi:hypothetical protein
LSEDKNVGSFVQGIVLAISEEAAVSIAVTYPSLITLATRPAVLREIMLNNSELSVRLCIPRAVRAEELGCVVIFGWCKPAADPALLAACPTSLQ